MRIKRFITTACAAMVACEWPTPVCACTPPYADYTLDGTVTSASGAPVSGASIAASVTGTSCAKVPSPYTFSPFGNATSAGDGSFSLTNRQFGDICMRVVVRHASTPDSVVQSLDFGPTGRRQSVSLRLP
jgi:hypothetical protein